MEHRCVPQGSCDECVIRRRTHERDRALEILARRDDDISRLTRERDEARAGNDYWFARAGSLKLDVDALLEKRDALEARLAAAERVVEAARWWNADTCHPLCGCSFCASLLAYDALKAEGGETEEVK